MIKIKKSIIKEAAPDRPAGYWEDIKQSAISEDGTFLWFEQETLDRLKVKYSAADHRNITFVYPFWQGGANYDELRWSIRSIYANFQPVYGQTFNVVVVGDQPIIRRTKATWYGGQIIHSPRISKGKTFRPKLKDALHKWRLALDSELVSDTIVWMMDDIYFNKLVTLDSLAQPRAFKHKSEASLERWNEATGFSSAKKRSMELLHDAKLPMWDFATHLPHVVDRNKVLEVFDKFQVQDNEVLWEVLYENYCLGEKTPERAKPFLAYFMSKRSSEEIKNLGERCTVMVNGGGSWNEELRRFLYFKFPTAAPCEILPAQPVQEDPEIKNSWLQKIATCQHRGGVQRIVQSKVCSRKGVELPVFQCNNFNDECTIDHYSSAQTERVCKKCDIMLEELE